MEWRESSVSPSRRALVREHHNCRLQHFTWEKVLVSSQHTQCSFCTQSHTDAVADTHTHTHTHTSHHVSVVMTSRPQSALSLVLWGHRMLIGNRKLVFSTEVSKSCHSEFLIQHTILYRSFPLTAIAIIQNTKKVIAINFCVLCCVGGS